MKSYLFTCFLFLLFVESQTELQKPHKLVLTKSRFLFGQAVEAEELNEIEEAIRLYTEAVELAFNGVSF